MKKALLIIALLFVAGSSYAATLTITWDANTESDLGGYTVYWRAADGDWTSADAGNVLTYTVNDVAENTEYCAKVTAYDTSGNVSEDSDTVCVTLDTQAPTKPTGIKAIIRKMSAWLKRMFG